MTRTRLNLAVTIADIDAQRAAGWPDFHPEDYCHRCGHRNMWSWHTDAESWAAAFPEGDAAFNGIVCPSCFAYLHELHTGELTTWEIRPWSAS